MIGRVGDALSGARRWGAEHRRGLAGAAVFLVVIGVAVLSVRPWSTTTYELEDSGVWLTRTDEGGQIGRLNAQIGGFDYVREGGATPGVIQDGRQVYLVTTEGASTSLAQLDPADAGADPLATVDLGADAQVGAGGGAVAALVDGNLRVVGRDDELGSSGPTVDVGEDGVLAVGLDGTVAGWSPSSGRLLLLTPGETEPLALDLPELDVGDPAEVTLSLVGEQPVVLDSTASGPRLLVPGRGPIDLGDDAAGARLQRPGPDTGGAVVATESGLVEVDLGSGDREVVEDSLSGDPVRPAVDDDCTFGAWTGAGTISVAAHCAGRDPVRREGDESTSADWRFRTGGPAVVLNDTVEGVAYVMVDGALERTAWPEEEQEPTEDEEFEVEPPKPRDNEAPEAVDDTGGPGTGEGEQGVGARQGRVTYLPVLRNDNDPNGDILAVDRMLRNVPAAFDDLISVVPDGRTVAIDLSGPVPEGASSVSFEYRATDGELFSEEYARVDVELVAADAEGQAPQAVKLPPMRHDLVAGGRSSFEVLSAFWDYDGDPLYLEEVTNPNPQHRVSWSADGRVTVTADQPDTVVLGLIVKDITGEAVASAPPLTVTVKDPAQPGDPVLRNDVVAAVVGKEITIDPLANDLSPAAEPLRLAEASEIEVLRPKASSGVGSIVTEDQRRLTFTPTDARDYVLLYQVETEGDPVEATILVRVAATAAPPVVRPDVVVVEETKSDEVDLLGNDVDPGGGLLSVTELTLPEGTTPEALSELMSVSVQDDYRTVRVDLRSAAESGGTPVTFGYTAENADAPRAAKSTVTVVVVPFQENRPPDTREARVSVRAGGVATVPLAAFASDPDRDPLEVSVPTQPEVGEARPSGDSIRYFAPTDATDQEVVVDVMVTEPAGNPQPARLTMLVNDADSPPVAPDLEGRVREGGTVTVALPLNRIDPATRAVGLDPDGDTVRLVGRSGTEQLDGKVTVDHGRQAFVFEVDDDAGRSLETFTYRVVDAMGRESDDGTVRILVTEPRENRPPVAMVDRASARAGAEIFVDPVANDTDLDGDPLALSERLGRADVEEAVVVEPPEQCEAVTTAEGLVKITTDDDAAPEDRCTVAYAVVDTVEGASEGEAASLPQEGVIVVTIRPDFTGVRPLARDDYIIRDAASAAGPVTVDVRANDEDRDGDPGALAVALVDDGGAAVDELPEVSLDPDSGQISVELAEEARVVRYRITDTDELEADALVHVPAADENAPPELDQDEPVEVTAGGEQVVAALTDLVRDPDGPTEQITFGGTPAPRGLDSGPLQRGLSAGDLVLEADPESAGTVQVPIEATDADGAMAVVEVEVTIVGAENTPPEWAGDPCGEVEAGVTRRIPLRASDRDTADNETLRFGVTGGTRELAASVEGRSLVVAADAGAAVGRTSTLTLTVTDGNPNGTATQECALRVVRSRQPPLRVNEAGLVVEQGEQGRIDVGQYVANAVGGLRVEGTPTVVPSTAGSATGGGTTVTFTADENAPGGQAVVTYKVSHDRNVQGTTREEATGRIVVEIRGRPDAPTSVTARALEEPGSVEVRWSPGNANGSPITGYEIEFTGAGGGSRPCRSTPCTLTGLKADGEIYAFSVVATNAVGPSEPSGPSNSVTLDQPPSAPTVTAEVAIAPAGSRDRLVSFTIRPGPARGSAVESFALSDAVNDTVPASTRTIPNVVVTGANACLVVSAVNDSGEQGPEGRACVPTYGRPFVSRTVAGAESGEGEITVTGSIDGNGDAARTSWTVTACGQTKTGRGEQVAAGPFTDCRDGSNPVTFTYSNTAGSGVPTEVQAVTVNLTPRLVNGSAPEIVAVEEGFRVVKLPDVEPNRSSVTRWLWGETEVRRDQILPADAWMPVRISVVGFSAAGKPTGESAASVSVTPFAAPADPGLSLGEPKVVEGAIVRTLAVDWGRPNGSPPAYDYVIETTLTDVSGSSRSLEDLTGTISGPLTVDLTVGRDSVDVSMRITDPTPGRSVQPGEGATSAGSLDIVCAPETEGCPPPCPAPDDTPLAPCSVPPAGGGAPAPRSAVVGPIPETTRRSSAPR